jgi:two-component system chemotaxis sensor kinase CheA
VEREKYISLFVDESKENLLALNGYLLELEKGSGDLHLLNDIFRVAHTLKGMASTMGFQEITELTHEMENLLDFLRNAQLPITEETIEVLFLCLDSLETLVDNVISTEPKEGDLTNLMHRLTKLTRTESSPEKAVENPKQNDEGDNLIIEYSKNETQIIKEAVENGYTASEIEVVLMKDSQMKSLRVLLILQSVEKKGQVIKTTPSREELNQEKFGRNFIITLIHLEPAEKIKEEILSIAEVLNVYIKDYNPDPEVKLSLNNNIIESENSENIEKVNLPDNPYNEAEKNVIIEAINQNFKCFELKIDLLEHTVMKFVRVNMVFSLLDRLDCQIIRSIPSGPELLDGNFDNSFILTIISDKEKEIIKDEISSIGEISQVEASGIEIKDFHDKEKQQKEHLPELNLDDFNADSEGILTVLESISPLDFTQKDNGLPEIELSPALKIESLFNRGYSIQTEEKSPVKTEEKTPKKVQVKKPTIRVDIERLDELINLVEELVMVRSRLNQIGMQLSSSELSQSVRSLSMISGNLQTNAMRLRMVPVEHIFNRFPRMIRDLSKSLNKDINFEIEGEETELDRTIIDEIGEPLVHLLRNAADHGIETTEKRLEFGKNRAGNIKLIARHEGNNVLIIIEDDGAGIKIERIKQKAVEKNIISNEQALNMTEEEALNILFIPGFSTVEVATDLSGRGVGMDAVMTKVKSIGGTINITSEEGIGTRFTIKLPLTLAIMSVLLVKVGVENYAVPITYIEEVKEFGAEEIKNINKTRVVVVRDRTIPLINLADLLRVNKVIREKTENEIEEELLPVIIVRTEEGKKTSGLIVDNIIGQEDVVIKSLGGLARDSLNYIAGTANLGSGTLGLILNIPNLT